MDLH
jgi:hypothetical protein